MSEDRTLCHFVVKPLDMASVTQVDCMTAFKPIKDLCLDTRVWLTGPADYSLKQKVVPDPIGNLLFKCLH